MTTDSLSARRPVGTGTTVSPHARLLYRALSQQGVVDLGRYEELMGTAVSRSAPLLELQALGLVRQTEQGIVVIPRRQAIDDLLVEQARVLARALDEVLYRQRTINVLNSEADNLDPDSDRVETVSLSHDPAGAGMYDSSQPASKELMAIHPGGQFPSEVLEHSLVRARDNLQAGVRLRVIHQRSALAHPASVRYLTAVEDLGGQVRIRDHLPFRMLLVDRQKAVCTAPGPGEKPDVYLVRGPRVTTLLDTMFETTWIDATPLRACLDAGGSLSTSAAGVVAHPDANGPSLSRQQHAVLKLLAEGETDQSIARHLGVTPRTVTRRVTELYSALGVDNRFQAGAVAQRAGLI